METRLVSPPQRHNNNNNNNGSSSRRSSNNNKNKRKMKVMVTMDESECSSRALQWTLENLCKLLEMAQPIILYTVQPEATLSHVPAAAYGPARMFTVMSVTPELIRSLRESQRRIAMQLLEEARDVCAKYGVSTELVVEIGKPKETICTAVDRFEIDLLILGSHRKGALQRALLGSVSNYCVQNAKCAVLVAKNPM